MSPPNLSDNTLYYIAPPGDGRPALLVAEEIAALLREDFCFSIADLCALFSCERQWVSDNFLPNVRHIHIDYFFRRYILENLPLEESERRRLSRGYYFFSRADLCRFWRETAAASRKAQILDLAEFLKPGIPQGRLLEVRQSSVAHGKNQKAARERALLSLLNENGQAAYALSQDQAAFFWQSASLPALDLSFRQLQTAGGYCAEKGLHSNSAAIRALSLGGWTRVKFLGKTFWMCPPTRGIYDISVPLSE